jgi:hypothetical protein
MKFAIVQTSVAEVELDPEDYPDLDALRAAALIYGLDLIEDGDYEAFVDIEVVVD